MLPLPLSTVPRAANGVIIITTKKGKAGPPVVTLNSSYGIQKDYNRMKLLSPSQFVEYQLERIPNDANNIYLSDGKSLDYYRNIPEIDWQDQLYRTAPMSNTSFPSAEATTPLKYYVSGNLLQQEGVMVNPDYKRYQGTMSLNQTFNPKLKGGVYVNYAYNKQTGASPSTSNAATALQLIHCSVCTDTGTSLSDGSTGLTRPALRSVHRSYHRSAG